MRYLFGIDIGGTSVKIGFFSENTELLEEWSMPTVLSHLIAEICGNIRAFLKERKVEFCDILGIGIGVCGIVKDGIVLRSVNLGWENVDVISEFQSELGSTIDMVLLNDANAATIAEFSVLRNQYSNMVFLTLGTGVGGGMVLNGQLLEGANGKCGEFGHLKVDDKYREVCSCGKIGCLETIVSIRGLKRLALHYQKILPTKLSFDRLTPKSIFDAARKKDVLAARVVTEAADALATAMVMISDIVDPEVFVLGGGISQAGSVLLKAVKDAYFRKTSKNSNTEILLSVFKNKAGIYGAAQQLQKKTGGK